MPAYPVQNIEYGTYSWLRREIGGYLGYGYSEATWDPEKSGKVDSFIQSGYAQYVSPPALPAPQGKPAVLHKWSFLTPVDTVAIVSGTAAYELPGDFIGLEGGFTATSVSTGIEDGGRRMVAVVPEEHLRQIAATDPQSGFPRYAAIRPRRSVGSGKQTKEVVFYPTPDTTANLEYRYQVFPEPLSREYPYPLGGKQYAELLLASCLAIADERETKDGSAARERFMMRLAAAVAFDQPGESVTHDSAWPLEAPSTGQVTKGYLRRLVGIEFGYGPHSAGWTHRQGAEIDLAMQTGLRKFYHPSPLSDERYGHLWSFLKPVLNLDLQDGIYRYDLPENFADLDSPIYFAPGSAVLYPPIIRVGEHQVRQQLARTEASSRPRICAVLPKPPDASGTRYELIVWPIPDQDYATTYRCQLNPTLTNVGDDAELPHGGPPHAQTLVEAILAAAEEQGGKQGLHSKLFLERLRTSVLHDEQAASPDTLGYDQDRSDRPLDPFSNWHDCDENIVTYNGVAY